MEIILYLTGGLLLLAIISVVAIIRQHNRMFKDKEVPSPWDELPEHYEVSERPYIEII